MTGFEFLLLALFVASVVLSLVGAVSRDMRWLSLGVAALAAAFLAELVNSL